MNDSFEKLGQAIDRVNNLAHALLMNLPPQMHVEQLRISMPEVVKELRESFIEISGENPWE